MTSAIRLPAVEIELDEDSRVFWQRMVVDPIAGVVDIELRRDATRILRQDCIPAASITPMLVSGTSDPAVLIAADRRRRRVARPLWFGGRALIRVPWSDVPAAVLRVLQLANERNRRATAARDARRQELLRRFGEGMVFP